MYRHSGYLSKGQKRGGTTVYRHSALLSKRQKRGGNTDCRHPVLYLKVREEVRPQCRDTQGLYPKVRGEL